MRLWTGFVGSIVEAWAELRVNRTRVLLSLIGVGVAVAALTLVVAGGGIATQVQTEQSERWNGRPATYQVNAYQPYTGEQAPPEVIGATLEEAAARYDIHYLSRNTGDSVRVQLADGVYGLQVQVVDQPYAAMHRLRMMAGAWFDDRDARRLAPAVIVSSDLWQHIGSPDLRTHPTLEVLTPERNVTLVITGITESPPGTQGMDFSSFMLGDAFGEARLSETPPEQRYYNFEMWLPPEAADELSQRISAEVSAALGEGWHVDLYRSDYLAYSDQDPLLVLKIAVAAIAGLVLLLGALGLLNIALVTVRYRIREIGIRRSFGATAGRVFFSVMMESVVATAFAGAIGVMIAVAVIKNPWVTGWLDDYLQDVPAFPVEAAVVGLVSATAVGALAGLLPALVAVRVKVIDAIRL
ncbi:ABC transporter permease [Protaetiibacter larvae]|uniref:ABC transporter permease n=1 Tax=Protaetiibacter larvae TaxID=2592654 RepID=A0A5C1Y912_9MICO|nr:ABC transporter permease [Protaetiibacter larvae]QEO09858.1 ABC transporter permease [Protaetiibacter larvae]